MKEREGGRKEKGGKEEGGKVKIGETGSRVTWEYTMQNRQKRKEGNGRESMPHRRTRIGYTSEGRSGVMIGRMSMRK